MSRISFKVKRRIPSDDQLIYHPHLPHTFPENELKKCCQTFFAESDVCTLDLKQKDHNRKAVLTVVCVNEWVIEWVGVSSEVRCSSWMQGRTKLGSHAFDWQSNGVLYSANCFDKSFFGCADTQQVDTMVFFLFAFIFNLFFPCWLRLTQAILYEFCLFFWLSVPGRSLSLNFKSINLFQHLILTK